MRWYTLVSDDDSAKWVLLPNVIVHTILLPSPVFLWMEMGGKPKWLPLNFGYHEVMCTTTFAQAQWEQNCFCIDIPSNVVKQGIYVHFQAIMLMTRSQSYLEFLWAELIVEASWSCTCVWSTWRRDLREHMCTPEKNWKKRYFVCKGLSHQFAIFFFCKRNAFRMRGGWVAIVSARKSRIALFEFACTMLWLTRQRSFIHRIWPVHDIASRGRFRKCNT